MTQKINIKEKFNNKPVNSSIVNEAYLKGARNASLNATNKSNKARDRVLNNNRQNSNSMNARKKNAEMRASSENKYSKGN